MNRNYVQLKQALEYTFAYTFAYTSKIYQSFLNLIILESSWKTSNISQKHSGKERHEL